MNKEQQPEEELDTAEEQSADQDIVEQLRDEASAYKDKYLRNLAEYENSMKRLQKERHQTSQYAIESIICEFLSPIDHLDRALQFTGQMSDDVKNWAKGFEMILGELKEVLDRHGVKPIEAKGKPFDPHMHEAIDTIETEEFPPGTVVEESLRGYTMKDKTIRPARVTVAKAPVVEPLKQENENKE